MKKFIIIGLLVFGYYYSFSQDVSVELSTEWKKNTNNRWKKIKLEQTSFLNIIYSNNSLSSLYFRKIPKNFDFIYAASICIIEKEIIDKKYLKSIKNSYSCGCN